MEPYGFIHVIIPEGNTSPLLKCATYIDTGEKLVAFSSNGLEDVREKTPVESEETLKITDKTVIDSAKFLISKVILECCCQPDAINTTKIITVCCQYWTKELVFTVNQAMPQKKNFSDNDSHSLALNEFITAGSRLVGHALGLDKETIETEALSVTIKTTEGRTCPIPKQVIAHMLAAKKKHTTSTQAT